MISFVNSDAALFIFCVGVMYLLNSDSAQSTKYLKFMQSAYFQVKYYVNDNTFNLWKVFGSTVYFTAIWNWYLLTFVTQIGISLPSFMWHMLGPFLCLQSEILSFEIMLLGYILFLCMCLVEGFLLGQDTRTRSCTFMRFFNLSMSFINLANIGTQVVLYTW